MTTLSRNYLLVLLTLGILHISGLCTAETDNPEYPDYSPKQIGDYHDMSNASADIDALISLLQVIGLDISYGDDGGTIFSMVSESLHRIISDLASGNSERFADVPLIRETFQYMGLDAEDLIVSPHNVSGEMEALERYCKTHERDVTYHQGLDETC